MRTQSQAIQNWRRKGKYSLPVEEGVLISVTQVFKTTPLFAEYAPYWIGLVEVGPTRSLLVGQLVNTAEWIPKIGDRVRATRRILYKDGDAGVVQYGIKWQPC